MKSGQLLENNMKHIETGRLVSHLFLFFQKSSIGRKNKWSVHWFQYILVLLNLDIK